MSVSRVGIWVRQCKSAIQNKSLDVPVDLNTTTGAGAVDENREKALLQRWDLSLSWLYRNLLPADLHIKKQITINDKSLIYLYDRILYETFQSAPNIALAPNIAWFCASEKYFSAPYRKRYLHSRCRHTLIKDVVPANFCLQHFTCHVRTFGYINSPPPSPPRLVT